MARLVASSRPSLAWTVLLLVGTAAGQLQLAELGKQHLARDTDSPLDVVLVDVDRDGSPDLFFANRGQDRLYRGDGQLGFVEETSVRLPVDTAVTTAVAAGDVDGDGDVDLVLGRGDGFGARTRLLRNDGQGRFQDVTTTHMPSDLEPTRDILLADVDKDGDLDVVVANTVDFLGRLAQNRLFLNDGKGKFTDVTAANLPQSADATNGVTVADVDGDGNLDLIFANEPASSHAGRNSLWLGDGKGKFADATSGKMTAETERTLYLAVGDVDKDNDLDLLVAAAPSWNGTKLVGGPNRLQLNDGRGKFTEATGRLPADVEETRDAVLADLDGDGDLDAVLASGPDGEGEPNHVWVNDGTGRFADDTARRLSLRSLETACLAVGDLDGDGDFDVVFGDVGTRNRVWVNDGAGSFVEATASPLPAPIGDAFAVAAGDLDGDGAPDLVFGTFFENRLLVSDGRSAYIDRSSDLKSGSHVTTAVALADVDGDGDLDLAIGNFGARDQLFLGDGKGKLTDVTSSHLPIESDLTTALAFLDADKDGDLDLIIGNSRSSTRTGQTRLYLNNGSGFFTDGTARLPVDSGDTFAVTAADLTGDGRPDVVLGNLKEQDRLYVQTATGSFQDVTTTNLPARADATRSVAAGDVDGDGDLDVLVGVEGARNRLWLNDGKGGITDATATRLPADAEMTRVIRLVDLDEDGDLDVFVGDASTSGNGARDKLYLGDGKGSFVDGTSRMPAIVSDTFAAAVADVDRDGDLDVVTGSALRSRVLCNLHRQLDAPVLARPGATYHLDVDAQPGYAPSSRVVLGMVGFTTLTPRVQLPPFGILHLDPAAMLLTPPATIAAPGGRTRFSLPLPPLPGLQGSSLYTQCVVIPAESTGDWRLTGLVADRLVF